MTSSPSRPVLLVVIGLVSLLPYLAALALGNLRTHTVQFEIAFFAAFILYLSAVFVALRMDGASRLALGVIFAVAIAASVILAFTQPRLSDDMYRYVWDGRVQAHGISPYLYPPEAPELANLRSGLNWVLINRKSAVTIYPPAAEAAYAVLWRIWPDNVRWFQLVMAGGGLIAGGLLVGLLRDLGRSLSRVLIYVWSPLLAFETAHSAHVDGLMLPFLVGAWWARAREKDALVGVLLGLATAIKLYPAVLAPVLWRPRHPQGRWQMPLAFVATLIATYLPYVLSSGHQVLGYLPKYFNEQFNISPLVWRILLNLAGAHLSPRTGLLVLTVGLLALMSLVMVLWPARDAEAAIARCIWPMGLLTLLSQDLFSWYVLWIIPLVALFLPDDWKPNAWQGWLLFSGLVALSYTFFIDWRPVPWAIDAQFWPLYAFLIAAGVRWAVARRGLLSAWWVRYAS